MVVVFMPVSEPVAFLFLQRCNRRPADQAAERASLPANHELIRMIAAGMLEMVKAGLTSS
jgi:hypothetical protein